MKRKRNLLLKVYTCCNNGRFLPQSPFPLPKEITQSLCASSFQGCAKNLFSHLKVSSFKKHRWLSWFPVAVSSRHLLESLSPGVLLKSCCSSPTAARSCICVPRGQDLHSTTPIVIVTITSYVGESHSGCLIMQLPRPAPTSSLNPIPYVGAVGPKLCLLCSIGVAASAKAATDRSL